MGRRDRSGCSKNSRASKRASLVSPSHPPFTSRLAGRAKGRPSTESCKLCLLPCLHLLVLPLFPFHHKSGNSDMKELFELKRSNVSPSRFIAREYPLATNPFLLSCPVLSKLCSLNLQKLWGTSSGRSQHACNLTSLILQAFVFIRRKLIIL
jgi:hypothetical protein